MDPDSAQEVLVESSLKEEKIKSENSLNKKKLRDSAISARLIAIVLFLCLSVSAVSIYIYDRYFATKIVSVDVQGYISKQRERYIAGEITGEQLRENMKQLRVVVDKIPGNKVVFTSDVVVRNAEVIKP